jgi:hypothetical protein
MHKASDILDEYMRQMVLMYFWPYFLAGNADTLKEIGRVYRPMCFR